MKINRFCTHNRGPRVMGIFGELFIDDEFICYTLERTWNDNRPYLSSVPCGEYELVPFNSDKHGKTFALYNPALNVYVNKEDRQNESDRFACLFHSGNVQHELQGCIAPGLELGSIRNQWAVLRSRDALKLLKSKWRSEKYLTITNEYEGFGHGKTPSAKD